MVIEEDSISKASPWTENESEWLDKEFTPIGSTFLFIKGLSLLEEKEKEDEEEEVIKTPRKRRAFTWKKITIKKQTKVSP